MLDYKAHQRKDGVCFTPYSSLLLQKTGVNLASLYSDPVYFENKNMGCYGKMSIVCEK
ncbi:MAG: hypothetical protein ACLU4J_00195 [Butyricimonas paravirosa]